MYDLKLSTNSLRFDCIYTFNNLTIYTAFFHSHGKKIILIALHTYSYKKRITASSQSNLRYAHRVRIAVIWGVRLGFYKCNKHSNKEYI